jgi:hypothetical protein
MHFHGVNLEKIFQFPQKNAINLFVFAGFCGEEVNKTAACQIQPALPCNDGFLKASAYLRFSNLKDLLLLLCI